MNTSSVFIIVPSFNEEGVLYQTVSALVKDGYHVVVIDDGSTIPQF
jgi:polyprenyl-phospho-N-acetylgalactosaminyl synthase